MFNTRFLCDSPELHCENSVMRKTFYYILKVGVILRQSNKYYKHVHVRYNF